MIFSNGLSVFITQFDARSFPCSSKAEKNTPVLFWILIDCASCVFIWSITGILGKVKFLLVELYMEIDENFKLVCVNYKLDICISF